MDLEISPFLALFTLQQSGLTDDLDVAGDRGLRHFQDVGEFTNAQRICHHQPNDAPASGIGQCPGEGGDVPHDGNSHNVKLRYGKREFWAIWLIPADKISTSELPLKRLVLRRSSSDL